MMTSMRSRQNVPATRGVRTVRAAAACGILALATGLAGCSGDVSTEDEVAFTTVAPTQTESANEEKKEATEKKDRGSETEETEEETETKSPSSSSSAADEPSDDGGNYITTAGGTRASQPNCDGRYILIIDSIIADPSLGDPSQRLADALASAPSGAEFTTPGHCASLRPRVHGHDIYPVYLDYGANKSGVCDAKSRYGGNARPLVNGNFPANAYVDVDEDRLALDPC